MDRIQRVEPVDSLFRPEGALLLYRDDIVRLSTLGEAIFAATTEPITLRELADRLADTLGSPAGDPLPATETAVQQLASAGVLTHVTDSPTQVTDSPTEVNDSYSAERYGEPVANIGRQAEKGTPMATIDCVQVPRVLLPRPDVDAARWAVVACDQYTSQPDYWEAVEGIVGEAPSTLRMVLPEIFLTAPDVTERIARAQATMRDYRAAGLLEPHDAFVYVERGVSNGVQQGLVVAIDLEAYDYSVGSTSLVRATEGTVLDRLPPRMAVRRGAELELPHILVLYDDPEGTVLADVLAARDTLPVAYDIDLMRDSGHLKGWLVDDPALQKSVRAALAALVDPATYEARYGLPADHPLLFAMGDGNHSLATAKAIWEETKAAGAASDHPARWALVELVNLHDASLVFEPIHRVIFEAGNLVADLVAGVGATLSPAADLAAMIDAVGADDAQRFGVITSEGYAVAEVASPSHELAVGTLQEYLDAWLAKHPEAEIDYVHGDDVTDELSRQPGNAGFLVPGIGKDAFFRSIAVEGALPRKTFSMGHAHDKRFYMECRAIVP